MTDVQIHTWLRAKVDRAKYNDDKPTFTALEVLNLLREFSKERTEFARELVVRCKLTFPLTEKEMLWFEEGVHGSTTFQQNLFRELGHKWI